LLGTFFFEVWRGWWCVSVVVWARDAAGMRKAGAKKKSAKSATRLRESARNGKPSPILLFSALLISSETRLPAANRRTNDIYAPLLLLYDEKRGGPKRKVAGLCTGVPRCSP